MTKKKSRKVQDQQFELKKTKSTSNTLPTSSTTKNRATPRIQKDTKKQVPHPSLPVFNKMVMQDRKAYEQKYRQNLVSKRVEQQKRGFRPMRYDLDCDSQMADIDEDSVNRRNDDETIKKIKEMLEEEEMIVNRQRCFIKARNQLAKVEKLSEMVYEKRDEYREIVDKVKLGEGEGVTTGWAEKNIGGSEKEGEIVEIEVPKTMIERIAELDSVYY